MSSLRVAYDCHVFTWQQYGGISRYFVELASRVGRAEGFSSEVVAPLHVNHYLGNSKACVIGFYKRHLPRTAGRLFRGANRAISTAYLWAFPPQVLHETYYGSWSYRPPGASVVVTVHDLIGERFPDWYPNDPTARRKHAAVERADRIICVSEHTRRDLMELLGVPENRIRVIHLGGGLQHPPSPHQFTPPGADPFLLYVGARIYHKNFSGLLKAYASSIRLRRELVVVAFGGPPFQRAEHALMQELGLPEGRVLHRSGSDADLARYYSHAAAFVYPSLYEGFGLPTLEAMSLGCPVICSNSSAFPEVAGNAAISFDPHDIEAMRDAMERVAFSQDLRAALTARGHEQTRRFSWDRCAAETMETYRELCGR